MAMEAATLLAEKGLDVRVINARFIKPLDTKMLDDLFELDMPLMTVEEAVLAGGFGSAVIEYANDQSYSASIKRMGIPDHFIEHGEVDELLAEIGMTVNQLTLDVESLIKEKEIEGERV